MTEAEGPRETLEITLPLAEDTVKLLALTLVIPATGAVRETGVKLAAVTKEPGTPESITKLFAPLKVTVKLVEPNADCNWVCKALAMSVKLVDVNWGMMVLVILPIVTDMEPKSLVLGLRLAKLTPDNVAV